MPAKVRTGEDGGGHPDAMAAAAETMVEVVSATCECCGLTEECTPAYAAAVRERYIGRWVCGLCGEAVEDEVSRAGRLISTEEALRRHRSFSESSRAAVRPVETAELFISSVRQLLRRSLSSPRGTRSNPGSPQRAPSSGAARSLRRSESCFSTVAQ